jgi:predicted cytidylate kinase
MIQPSLRITLSGDLGSGKSSVGRRLAAKLGVPYFSAGALFREIGRIDNLDALDTNLVAENNTDIDRAVDERTRDIDQTVASFIIDSRMAWHFVRNATRAYLSVSRETAAHRIMGDGSRGDGESYANHAAAVAALGDRRISEAKRYSQLYGVDITNFANYDVVIATDDAEVADVVDLLLAVAIGDAQGKFWLPRARLVPTFAWQPSDPGSQPPAAPLPLTVVRNFGFYTGECGPLLAALATRRPFIAYGPEPLGAARDAIADRARRTLTPGLLGQWVEHAGVGRAFCDLLGPATP